MKSIRNLLQETADGGATSAGDVAGVRAPLSNKPIRRKVDSRYKVKRIKFNNDMREHKVSALRALLAEFSDDKPQVADTIAKLKSASKNFEFEKDSVAFGIDDDNGNMVKVYVRANQAEQFERTLSEIMRDGDNEKMDVAEMLFSLKDKFNIVHVEWGTVEEDEEKVDDSMSPPEDAGEDLELVADEPSGDENVDGELEMDDNSSEESALDKVIAMLKADAEARTAEAKAREASANAEEARYAAQASEIKMKGEEEVLDMETHFKQQADEKKQAQKLAKLAKYRHEKALDIRGDNDDIDDNDGIGDIDGEEVIPTPKAGKEL